MRFASPGIILLAASLCAQQTASQKPAPVDLRGVAPETVVATMNGEQLTAGQLKAIVEAMDPRIQETFKKNPRVFLAQLAKMDLLSKMAEKQQLDLRSPLKEQIRLLRMNVLAPAAADAYGATVQIPPLDVKKFYDANPDRYTHAHVRGIYIPYKTGTEAEALAEAQAAVKAARGGADFVKLVKQYSKDAELVAKEGDFGTVRKSDKMTEPVKQAIFGLRVGEVSDPVRQPNGFFVFRLEEAGIDAFDKVKDEIRAELVAKAIQQWVAGLDSELKVSFENDTLFPPAVK